MVKEFSEYVLAMNRIYKKEKKELHYEQGIK